MVLTCSPSADISVAKSEKTARGSYNQSDKNQIFELIFCKMHKIR